MSEIVWSAMIYAISITFDSRNIYHQPYVIWIILMKETDVTSLFRATPGASFTNIVYL